MSTAKTENASGNMKKCLFNTEQRGTALENWSSHQSRVERGKITGGESDLDTGSVRTQWPNIIHRYTGQQKKEAKGKQRSTAAKFCLNFYFFFEPSLSQETLLSGFHSQLHDSQNVDQIFKSILYFSYIHYQLSGFWTLLSNLIVATFLGMYTQFKFTRKKILIDRRQRRA